ncbi:MAG: cation-transporting P-type ATPase [Phycisphaerae bacterium]|nr:cation-transporting P-type ATPase [Phycisphaerae bacterium]
MNPENASVIASPWCQDAGAILQHFGVTREKGLKDRQVLQFVKLYGLNRLREAEKVHLGQILLNQVKSLIVILLAVAALLSFAFQEWLDGFAITGVIVINTAIGFFMELKAIRSMEALHQMERVTAKVRRNGQVREIPAVQLVPGDIVVLEGGDIVSADMRLLVSGKLQADESVLTGESLPVSKQTVAIDESAVLAERTNMLFKGTSITRGSGEAVVMATGMETELGRIMDLVQKAEDEVTPLEKRLDLLGRNLLWVTLILIVIIAAAGIVRGKNVIVMIETAIALAVAAIPEGLPIVATLALARGMMRMARRNAIVNELAAVETLGSVSVICTDKTGTLTENKMTVTGLVLSDQDVIITAFDEQGRAEFLIDGQTIDPLRNERVTKALEVGVLCSNASLKNEQGDSTGIGDPLEVALLIAARKASIDYEKLNQEFPEEREDAFDSDTKKMSTFNRFGNTYWVAVKGALEVVLEDADWVTTENRREAMDEKWRSYWLRRNAELAEKGYRVLALAIKEEASLEADPYKGLEFVGLVCMEDPARKDVREAIMACRNAGIQIVMVTGDHPKTAGSIAASVGLIDSAQDTVMVGKEIKAFEELSPQEQQQYRQTPVFARVSPKQKLDLIAVHQKAGAVVAMTGDGVNDAPALKKADIGIAMGLRGTQVAREAADMVLKDDAFSTIVVAIEQGRIIFENIRKFVVYLLSCNISEVMVVFVASVVNAPLPILPLQILFLNLVTDVFPALALGAGKGNPGIMESKPRSSDEPILNRRGWTSIFSYGLLITVSVMVAFWLAFKMGMERQQAVTVSFLTLALSQLWHIFNMRGRGTDIFDNEIVKNPFVWGALATCVGLLLMAVYMPLAARILNLTHPGMKGWLLVLVASVLTCIVGQLFKQITRKPQAV